MTFSPLISGTIPSHGKYNSRPGGITRVIQHHWADTTLGGQAALENPNTKKSVNYLVHTDGVILGQVPEEFRPWTSGGAVADNPSITIECQNSTGGPEWAVSGAAIDSIARLIADIAARRGFGSLNRTNYRGHREFAATACPGPYLWPRLQPIAAAANALRAVPVNIPAPAPTLTGSLQEDDMITLILWCYAELIGRPNPPSVAEIENWVSGTGGWNGAQVLNGFLGAIAEPGSIDKAYLDILGRHVDPAGAASNSGKTVRQVRVDLAAAAAAGAR